MKINTKIRYSLRMIILLAQEDRVMNTVELGEKMIVSPKYLRKLAGPLEKHKIIKSVQGIYGGYLLAKKPEEITLKMIFQANDVIPTLHNCFSTKACPLSKECMARPLWDHLENIIRTNFFEFTIQNVLDKNFTT